MRWTPRGIKTFVWTGGRRKISQQRVKHDFAHIRDWVFDLDHTLYPPKSQLFSQIEIRMEDFISTYLRVSIKEAKRLRTQYWADHGTTLAGLMDNHAMEPHDFLADVHDIDFSVLTADPALSTAISNLPGRKIIYTNGTADYAEQVLKARGLDTNFSEIYGVEHANFRPKPERNAFEHVFSKANLTRQKAAMFEDDPRNLSVPYDMGLKTVLVAPDAQPADHIHHHTQDLTAFLTQLID